MNDENLNKSGFFRLGDEATREAGKKGGIASGITRSFRAATKKRLKENPDLIADILDMLIGKILSEQDLKALELLIELAGESPRQMEISLKKQELKLKKENAENQNW